MVKSNIIVAIIVILVLIGTVAYIFYFRDGETTGNDSQEGLIGETKYFAMTAKNWEFEPSTITVNKGDLVKINIKSIDVDHGIRLSEFNVNEKLEPNKEVNIEFIADQTGEFTFSCNVFCGEGHSNMKGTLIVN
jgi:cytochrome c oxidase subunit 2